jgi:hypothetical protein
MPDEEPHADPPALPPAGPDAAPKAPQLDGELLAQISNGDLPNQLADMTSALQEQLQAITSEMNRLKRDINSEQGGLAARLGALSERVTTEASDSSKNPASSVEKLAPDRRRSGAALSCEQRPRSTGTGTGTGAGTGGKRIEWAPGTASTDGMSRRDQQRQMRAAGQEARARLGWTPYLVGVGLVCLGPLRPLVWELLKQLWEMATRKRIEEEPAWYDQ